MDDDREVPPRLFANHVIKQMASHALSDEIIVEPQDYMVIRTAFRGGGGSWVALCEGDLRHMGLLQQIVNVWGQMPGRKTESDEVV